jgi:hypothetical protein
LSVSEIQTQHRHYWPVDRTLKLRRSGGARVSQAS